MKRICSLFLFVCLLLIGFSASANVFSHRYFIPNTDYTIEFPVFFDTFSSEISEHEPFLYESNFDLESAQSLLSNCRATMAAFTNDTGYDLSVFIYVTEADLGFSSQSLSEEELERVAKVLSDAYYSGNDNVRSLTPEKPYEIEQIGKLTYISLGDYSIANSNSIEIHYYLFENDYKIEIFFCFNETDNEIIDRISLCTDYILKSIN